LSLSRWAEYFCVQWMDTKNGQDCEIASRNPGRCKLECVPCLIMCGCRTCDSGRKCACETPSTEMGRKYLLRGFASVFCDVRFLNDCIKRSKISQNFCTNNLVLVTQRFTAWVTNFMVNQISWRNDIPEHNHKTIIYTAPTCFDFYIVIIRGKIGSSTSVVRCIIADTVYK